MREQATNNFNDSPAGIERARAVGADAVLPGKGRSDDVALASHVPAWAEAIRRHVGRRIVGQDQAVRVLLAAVLAEGHVLLIGVPGLAKTLLVRSLSQALGWQFGRIQFTPDLMPSDVTGSELLAEEPATGRRTMRFAPGPVFANLLLADEINRTPPRTQAALLEAMQERTVTSLGQSHPLPRPFVVVATQNPIEQEGTYPLPEAQLDRFMFSLRLGYPSVDEERTIAGTRAEGADPACPAPAPASAPVPALGSETTPSAHTTATTDEGAFGIANFRALQTLVDRVPVADPVRDHAVALVRATRPSKTPPSDTARTRQAPSPVGDDVLWGCGPRASQHLVTAARALALLDGLPAPAFRHVREAAPWVLTHRLVLSYGAAAEGVDARAIVRRVLEVVPEPQ